MLEETAEAVAGAILRCAEWHGTPRVIIHRSEPEAFGCMLTHYLEQAQAAEPLDLEIEAADEVAEEE
jgi:hypothetical protein